MPAFKTLAFPACVIICYKRDTVQLGFTSLRLNVIPDIELRSIRFLELKCTSNDIVFMIDHLLVHQLQMFHNLDKVTFLVESPPDRWDYKYELLDHMPWQELTDCLVFDELVRWTYRLAFRVNNSFTELRQSGSGDRVWRPPVVALAFLSRKGRRFKTHLQLR